MTRLDCYHIFVAFNDYVTYQQPIEYALITQNRQIKIINESPANYIAGVYSLRFKEPKYCYPIVDNIYIYYTPIRNVSRGKYDELQHFQYISVTSGIH